MVYTDREKRSHSMNLAAIFVTGLFAGGVSSALPYRVVC